MIRLTYLDKSNKSPEATVTLTYDQRTRSRLKVDLDNGEAVGIYLQRGKVLSDNHLLHSEDGRIIRVIAANEQCSIIHCDTPLLLMRGCYHLGNRHVALQIESTQIRYLQDHVLDQMCCLLGLNVSVEMTSFHPESGAYGGGNGHHH